MSEYEKLLSDLLVDLYPALYESTFGVKLTPEQREQMKQDLRDGKYEPKAEYCECCGQEIMED